MAAILEEICELLQKGRAAKVKELVQQALDENVDPFSILNQGLLAGIDIIGTKFKNNEVFVPEVLVAARAMNAGIEILKPHLSSEDAAPKATVVLGTVRGDLHDIGKNLVRIMLNGKGFNVIDLGVDVSPEQFYSSAVENDAKVVCCSSLLTTTMPEMRKVVELFEANNKRDSVKIMVGGAPVTQNFCDSIGADGYTSDASSCAALALSYCS